MSEKANKPPPRCKAILLCDQVIHDAVTRKPSLINLFDYFVLPKFPGTTRPYFVFLQMVDGIDSYSLTAEIRDLQDDSVIATLPTLPVRFPDRASRVNVDIGSSGVHLPHEGIFELVVYADGQEIDRRRFGASQMKGPPPPPTFMTPNPDA